MLNRDLQLGWIGFGRFSEVFLNFGWFQFDPDPTNINAENHYDAILKHNWLAEIFLTANQNAFLKFCFGLTLNIVHINSVFSFAEFEPVTSHSKCNYATHCTISSTPSLHECVLHSFLESLVPVIFSQIWFQNIFQSFHLLDVFLSFSLSPFPYFLLFLS